MEPEGHSLLAPGWGSGPPAGQCQAVTRHPWASGRRFPLCAFGSNKLQLIPLATLFLNDITFSISPLPERCLPADLHLVGVPWVPWVQWVPGLRHLWVS